MNTMNKYRINFIGLSFLWILCTICALQSCKDDRVDPPETPQTENRSTDQVNNNIVALKKLVDAQSKILSIQSCTPLTDGPGYNVVFSDGTRINVLTTVTISINEKEENNITVNSPKIGIKEEGNTYYWTLDGKWLLSEITNGNKILVIGEQSITPVVTITEDGYWEITCGNHKATLGKVEGAQLDSYFSKVDISNPEHILFSFTDGSSIQLPIYKSDEDPQEPITGHLRRIISPDRPMWLVHIDTWNYADPQKIIDLIPTDIRPYVVFNISLSVNRDENTGEWKIVEYGYETAKSWLRTCAQNRVWAVVQPSSGGFSHFPDIDNYAEMETSLYNEFFRDYPNFLGFNYCEQFWGFNDKFSVTYPQRLAHWTNLMKLSHKYGGYLVISFNGPYWAAANNPVAMLKRDANLAEICRQHPENLIVCEKLTSKYGFFDTESTVLGAYLSGYAGQAGLRSDQTGWNGLTDNDKFPVSAGAIPIVERTMLSGVTVLDGPELIWLQCFKETDPVGTSNGYTMRQWETFPQFQNINIDIFRKIIDGTIRIPGREEVIDRTKIVMIQDVNSGNDRDMYTSPETLYEGLYRMDDDGNMLENRSWFKKTGRYPTIPIVYQLNDPIANSFEHKVNKSQAVSHWSDVSKKVNEFNALFPQEYTGNMFAGRFENGWVTYNPYKTGQTATASIPFKYNTCESLDLTYSKYSLGVIKEYADKVTFYLTNYDNADLSLKTDVIKIYGSSSEPTYSFVDRGNHTASTIVKQWENNVLTLTVTHNGALDLTVRCAGNATDRETAYKTASISLPELPEIYRGTLQHEAEHFDYKNIAKNLKSGTDSGIGNYTGQGYVSFGTSSSAAVRDEVTVLDDGVYSLQTRYRAPTATVGTIDLYINGTKVTTPEFTKTENNRNFWDINTQAISLNKGKNIIEFRANSNAPGDFYIDNVLIKK